ncbi:MAG: MFS transporter [Hyphomicrobiales bacterium]
MIASVRQIGILMIAVAFLSLGHGLHGSLVGVRASAENFSTQMTGLIMSAYFAGLLLSAWLTPRIVQTVGHIRVFAGFASVVSTAVMLYPLWINETWWLILRFAAGFCTSGLYIVCESWMNSASSNQNRGKMLSVYMVVSYGAMGLGQLLLNVNDGSGFARFIIVSALLSLSLVPLSLVPTETPSLAGTKKVSLGEIYRASPLAVVATFANGLAQSAFFSMGAVFGIMQGMALPYVSLMMALPPIGVILTQFPAGALSDRYDRRTVIMAFSAASVVIALAAALLGGISPFLMIAFFGLFGCIALPIYSLVMAHANDHLHKDQMLGGSGKLILLYGLGAMMGPLLAGQFMQMMGYNGFLYYLIVVYAAIAGMTMIRRVKRPENIKMQSGEGLRVGPMSTPMAAQAIAKE